MLTTDNLGCNIGTSNKYEVSDMWSIQYNLSTSKWELMQDGLVILELEYDDLVGIASSVQMPLFTSTRKAVKTVRNA